MRAQFWDMMGLGEPLRMRSPTSLPSALFFCVCLLSLPAWAAPRTTQVVVLETRTAGEVRAEDRARIGDALWAALDRLGIRRVADGDREAVLQGGGGLRACLDRDECQERLGRLLEATHVIGVGLTRTAPTAFRLEVQLFDVDVGERGAAIDWSCTACSIEDVAHKLDSLVESTVQKDHERARATLIVRSTPPNADVQVDGRKLGYTELEHRVFAGPHELIVTYPGMAPERMRIEVAGEQRLVLHFQPGQPGEKDASPPAPPIAGEGKSPPPIVVPAPDAGHAGEPGRSRWKLGLGIPLMLLGVAGGGLGVATLVLDGHCADAGCAHAYDGKPWGYIEAGIGAGLLAVGVTLVAVDVVQQRRAHRQAAQARLLLTPVIAPAGGGALFGLGSSF